MDCSVSLDPAMATAALKFAKTGQVQVIFRSVEETYPVGVDIQCTYSVGGSLDITSRDWVGLYRVGWRSKSDYFYYDWAPMPQDHVKGKDFEGKIVFPAYKLPKDDGEFYQFCYVTSSGQVRGASTPFQFRQASVDDLIEIEDENGELLVIKTKTALLEEKLKKANELKTSMKQQIQALENERNLLMASERQLQRKLQQQKEEEEAIREKLEEANDMTNEQKLQLQHLQVCISAFQEKTEILNQEKVTMEKRLDENDAYIVSLQEKIKTLVNEKDSLTGRIRSLEEEGELLRGYVIENDRLKTRLMEEEICGARMKKEVERMEEEIQEEQSRMEKQLQVSSADKETIDFLCERIRNAEDKLGAAEHCKMMLNEEVLTMKQAFEKMSSNLEEAKLSTDSIQKTLCLTEQNLNIEIKHLNDEKQATQEKLDAVNKENKLLSKELAEVKEHLEEKSNRLRSEAEGSLYAMEMAQATLKDRYLKMTKKFEANQRTLENALCRVHELEMTVEDEKQEIDHLKERLHMAEETYKEKYVECEILENKLFKQKHASYKKLASKETSESNLADVSAESEFQQTEYMRTTLETYHAKVNKYKKLFVGEKLRADELLKKLMAKDEEFNLMKDFVKPRGPPNDAYLKTAEKDSGIKNENYQRTLDMTLMTSVKSMESFDAMDDSGIPGMMQVPLRPLPPPMLPDKVCRSGAAVVRNPLGKGNNSWNMDEISNLETDHVALGVNDLGSNSLTAAVNIDGERFEDAPGEPQKICPVCSCVFSYAISESQLVQHIEEHFCGASDTHQCDAICPVCSKMFPESFSTQEFTRHVNEHFESP